MELPATSGNRRALAPIAVLLLLTTTGVGVCRSCSDADRRALLRSIHPLFTSELASGYDWPEEGADCCGWRGVECGGAHGRRVVQLSLVNLGIGIGGAAAGVLDVDVFAPLSELQRLDLSSNQISGFSAHPHSGFRGLEKMSVLKVSHNRLTDEGLAVLVKNLTALSELHVAYNHLWGTSWISNLTSLRVVDMSFNRLHELEGICGLHQLNYLHLDFNMLHGIINPCLGKLHQLTYLSMGTNFLTGEIGPDLLSNLSQVETIHLAENNMTGTFIFSSLANNSRLREIVISDNHNLEIETELVRWAPLFQLEFLNLSNTIINKRSNGIVPTFLSTQVNISGIDLSICSLQGRAPPWLFHNLSDFLLLHSNNLDFIGTDGLSGNFTSPVEMLDLSDNKISMELPGNFGGMFPSLQYLDMSDNQLYGGIPSLAEATPSLQVLDLSFNGLDGDVSPTLIGNASILTSILLSHNELTGPMPPSRWSLGELTHLSLENNRFSGGLSPLRPNCSSLKTLNARNNHLSGAVPEGLLSSQNFEAILLGRNRLHGRIPWDFCLNNHIHFIDLSNNLFSGEIPGCLYSDFWTYWPINYDDDRFQLGGNVTQRKRESIDFTTKWESLTYMGQPLELMTGIDLSMNRLSGTIPTPIGYLRKLKSLNLSHNVLTGSIPESFMYLLDMESLDLSHNRLNGSLPVLLANLSFLCSFSVAYNNLSGEIPFVSQLSTFDETAFEGNQNLCGEIIGKTCPTSPDHEEDDRSYSSVSSDAMDTPLLYWSIVAGSFALGFWGAVAFLAWNAGCRRKLIIVMDVFMYKLGWYLVP